ncbi:replication factor A protein 1-like, partial [Vigna unguiculata]|uniref:replication factor A protein 1-like n=1 Tax=Vigna unguiculata TaxID=3917 RepID=UPI001015D0D4
MSLSELQKQTQNVSQVTPEKENWNIIVRVIRSWFVPDFTKQRCPFSMELVIQDKEGSKIHASIRRTLIYKFQTKISEGDVYAIQNFSVAPNSGIYRTTHHPYKINFQFGTKVSLLDGNLVPDVKPQYTPLSLLTTTRFDTDYLVDVLGLLVGVGTERELQVDGKTTKLNVIAIEADGFRIECTLFGIYVDELNVFLSSGEVQNCAISIEFAKVKTFQDKVQLQNCKFCTRIKYNVNFKEASELKSRMIENNESPSQGLTQLSQTSKNTVEEDFLTVTPRTTIQGLKDCKEVATFILFGTINHILDEDDWWYTACVCNKVVYPDSKMFFCEKCNKHVIKVFPRYRIKVRVIDSSDSITFVLFDRDATTLFKKTCADMLESHDKMNGCGNFPKEFEELVNKSLLFKVESRNDQTFKLEQSFRVKKICLDDDIIEKFNDSSLKSV